MSHELGVGKRGGGGIVVVAAESRVRLGPRRRRRRRGKVRTLVGGGRRIKERMRSVSAIAGCNVRPARITKASRGPVWERVDRKAMEEFCHATFLATFGVAHCWRGLFDCLPLTRSQSGLCENLWIHLALRRSRKF